MNRSRGNNEVTDKETLLIAASITTSSGGMWLKLECNTALRCNVMQHTATGVQLCWTAQPSKNPVSIDALLQPNDQLMQCSLQSFLSTVTL